MQRQQTSARHPSRSAPKSGLTRKVLKVMAMFTGLQMFSILCSVIKMKFVALWLQATGVGLFGIFNTTTDTIGTLTDLGLRQSCVRAVAAESGKASRMARLLKVVRRWSMASGLLGAIVLSGLSWPLALWFFHDSAQWWQFAVLSAAMLFNSIASGEQAILQGAGKLKRLARSSLIASVSGLALSIPMFYWLGDLSITASITAYSVAGLAAVAWVRYKPEKPVQTPSLTIRDTLREGSDFLRLGVAMAVAAFITNLTQMGFLSFLTADASLTEVGYYQAGTTLVVRYMGLIFTALGMEYFPRLVANAHSARRTQVFVTHETRLLLLIITPVIVAFMLLRHWIVLLLYTPEFEAIIPFITWAVVGCIFKAVSWCMAFVMLARGDGRIYILTETVDAVVGLGLNIIGFRVAGLLGLGVAFVVWYALYTLMAWLVYRYRYHLRLPSRIWLLTAAALMLTSLLAVLLG